MRKLSRFLASRTKDGSISPFCSLRETVAFLCDPEEEIFEDWFFNPEELDSFEEDDLPKSIKFTGIPSEEWVERLWLLQREFGVSAQHRALTSCTPMAPWARPASSLPFPFHLIAIPPVRAFAWYRHESPTRSARMSH